MRDCFSPLLVLLAAFLGALTLLVVTASDCPLDLSWSNFTLIASTCSSGNERAKCCRFINAIVAVSVARYAKITGQLGVPPAFSEMCISSITDTLSLYGIQPNAISFCGFGTKILVNYQCKGRATVLDMLQSPNFTDVVNNCKKPLYANTSCRRCLNSDMLFLHHVLGADDNVTLSTCRNAAFVALTNEGDHALTTGIASCLFGIQGLGVFSGDISVPPSPSVSPKSSPGLASAGPPRPPLNDTPSKDLAKEHRHPFRLTFVQGLGIGVTAVAVLLLIILVLLIRKKSRELNDTASPASSNVFPPPSRRFQEGPPSLFKRFSYREAKKATRNFSTEIGRGGFGTVYKAQFSDCSVAAIKKMNKVSQQGENDFCKEMELLGRLHHRHLVALKGFCVEKRERFLVYEFMENGSLKDNLHGQGRTPLSWEARMQIAIDVANALEYLHFYCDPPLCHRDIKSSNILLDENFVAKVADFGLVHASRSGSISFEPVNTDIRGTPGYMDPEYVVTQELTEKSDIYSYGVVLLELVTGRRAIQDNRNIVEWSQKFMNTYSQLHELVDPLISDSYDFEQLRVIVGISQCCIQQEGKFRPSIKQVLRMLYEGLDPGQREFVEAIGDFDDEDFAYRGLGVCKGKSHRSVTIPHSGETRCLMSSSSTSRSYCSRSLLLESGSPESPINVST